MELSGQSSPIQKLKLFQMLLFDGAACWAEQEGVSRLLTMSYPNDRDLTVFRQELTDRYPMPVPALGIEFAAYKGLAQIASHRDLDALHIEWILSSSSYETLGRVGRVEGVPLSASRPIATALSSSLNGHKQPNLKIGLSSLSGELDSVFKTGNASFDSTSSHSLSESAGATPLEQVWGQKSKRRKISHSSDAGIYAKVT